MTTICLNNPQVIDGILYGILYLCVLGTFAAYMKFYQLRKEGKF